VKPHLHRMSTTNSKDNRTTALYCAISAGVGLIGGYVFSRIYGKSHKSVAESTKLWKENPNLYNYIMQEGNRCIPELQKIHDVTQEKFGEDYADWITSQDQCYLFVWLCNLLNVKKAIEVGVFTGSSALCIAQSIRKDHGKGELVAIDHVSGKQFTDVAEASFTEAKLDDIVSLRLNGGIDGLDEVIADKSQVGTFDFAYVDAMKTEYMEYYERLLTLVKSGGVLAFDNTLLCGRVADLNNLSDLTPDHQARVKYMVKFNKKVKEDKRVEMCMIAIGDGLTLVRKK